MTRAMKNSGIEWIGEIPSDWKVEKNKHCFELTKNIVGEFFADYELLSLTKNGIIVKDANSSFGKVPESYETYQKVKQGQIVLCLFDLDCSAVFSGLSNYDGMISPAYKVYDCKECIDTKYAEYWFDYCFDGRKYMIYSKSLRYVVNADDFGTIEILLPPLSEQKKIADFLDSKISKIDKIIIETKESIENYKEYKQSVITEAVTKGLNKNVQMKDSGIDWIGEIPADWSITKYGRCATVKSNLVPPEEYPDYPQISPDNIEKGSGKLLNTYSTVAETGVISNNHLFFEGQIIYSKIRPLLNKVMIATFSGLCSADMYPIETTQHTKFLLYLMLSNYFITQVALVTEDRVKMPKINQEELSNIIVVLPSLNEQKEIADFLDSKIVEIDNIISEKEALVSNLEEYKKSLIYEYVTGKKAVL